MEWDAMRKSKWGEKNGNFLFIRNCQTEKIQLIWNENYEYSKKFYDDAINCSLQIDIGCYHVEMKQYYSEARALLGFASALKNCCKTMQGTAE